MTIELSTETDELQLQQSDHVLWLRLNRPQALNALTASMVDDLTRVIVEADEDPEVRVIVLTGTGRAFCAGADLKDSAKRSPESGARFVKRIGELTNLIEECTKPVIAAVNGIAIAGGLELVLACDTVIAAESAVLGDAHSNYAMFPGAGATVRLPRKVGLNNAKYLMFTGDMPAAHEWLAMGLVSQVIPDEGLNDAVSALASKLAGKSPLGLAKMKQALNDSLDQPAHIGLRYERALVNLYSHSADRVEGLAAFREKRTPHFQGK
ncbi:enoyl-CoA hydratase/isomerase family protein [Arthrobacter sp. ISL-65]|jgi:enoyl-CoA hydratase/carnithine racemase|uniref:enoyl-CoA hydratase/isomerase family protein n=1 Tax=Arthrobacter sp. ISL-65 TaxID=2819112 RepID=UPI001BEB0E3D|nr:enoyl-CoA hydratase/isomerase family protein [Arthrobacter sp. ISL-65]MBT2550263.1 enoyl-CoA hydratase/isomerase family protein [Arthrobacter sp. ISL-65]